MPQLQQFDVLILGSGTAGKLMAWHMAGSGRRTAVVERRWVGGSCPNIACMPSKNEIRSAEVAHLARHAAQFGFLAPDVVKAIVDNRMPRGVGVTGLVDLPIVWGKQWKALGISA